MAELSLKLLYFPARARGESIRMMLKHAKIPYEDIMITGEEFYKMKQEKKLPLGQLPVLEVNGKLWPQSGALLRFLGKISKSIPEDPKDYLRTETVLEAARDLSPIDPVVNRFDGDTLKSTYDSYFGKQLPVTLDFLTEALSDLKFFGGDEPSYADFGVYHYLDNTVTVKPDAIRCEKLKMWMERIAALPGVAEYLSTRPPIPEKRMELISKL
eukprot:g8002.t1